MSSALIRRKGTLFCIFLNRSLLISVLAGLLVLGVDDPDCAVVVVSAMTIAAGPLSWLTCMVPAADAGICTVVWVCVRFIFFAGGALTFFLSSSESLEEEEDDDESLSESEEDDDDDDEALRFFPATGTLGTAGAVGSLAVFVKPVNGPDSTFTAFVRASGRILDDTAASSSESDELSSSDEDESEEEDEEEEVAAFLPLTAALVTFLPVSAAALAVVATAFLAFAGAGAGAASSSESESESEELESSDEEEEEEEEEEDELLAFAATFLAAFFGVEVEAAAGADLTASTALLTTAFGFVAGFSLSLSLSEELLSEDEEELDDEEDEEFEAAFLTTAAAFFTVLAAVVAAAAEGGGTAVYFLSAGLLTAAAVSSSLSESLSSLELSSSLELEPFSVSVSLLEPFSSSRSLSEPAFEGVLVLRAYCSGASLRRALTVALQPWVERKSWTAVYASLRAGDASCPAIAAVF